MAELTHPWPVYGIIRKNGTAQSGLEVKVEDETQSFSHSVNTKPDGSYLVTLTKYGPVYDGDNVKVTVVSWGCWSTDTATEGEAGSEINFNPKTYNIDALLSRQDLTLSEI